MSKTIEKRLPVIVLREQVPIPDNVDRLRIQREMYVRGAEVSEEAYNNEVLLVIQKNPLIDNPTYEDLHPIGVRATIKVLIRLNDGVQAKLHFLEFVKVFDYKNQGDHITATFSKHNISYSDIEIIEVAKKMILKKIDSKEDVLENQSKVIKKINEEDISIEEFVNVISYALKIDNKLRLKYLLATDFESKLKYILSDIDHRDQIKVLESKIEEEVTRNIQEANKEFFLREKIKVIQQELGDRAKKDDEIEELKAKILECKMPEETEKSVLKELKRYQTMPSFVAESATVKNFLDIMVSLPWNKYTEDNTDLKNVKEVLDKNHNGLEKVKEKILEYIAVQIKTKRMPQAILCLVGPPGTGKTSLAISIAEALNKKFVKFSLGGVDDEADIMGFRKTYVGAIPGGIIKQLQKAGSSNPLFLLDEIDKLGKSYKGDPAAALLEVLDPSQNKNFTDHFLDEPFDLSKIFFITTANYLENIPEPLRDRMELIFLSSYTEQEKQSIAKNHLIPDQLKENGLTTEEVEFTDEAVLDLIRFYTREAGVRQLNRLISSILRKLTKKILTENVKNDKITSEKVVEYLGKHIFSHNMADNNDKVGLVNGLAYTQYGGDTLNIECNYYSGKGMLILTGKLGEVMKESASIALSYVKSKAKDLNIDPKIFQENDFHIHAPEGAVPKDGPSAGVTLATAILSAVTKRKVRHDIGMTGEITLNGQVLPIGGLKEKSIAAKRSGLKTILIPIENVKDLDEVPEEVKSSLEIIPVSSVSEVFEKALV